MRYSWAYEKRVNRSESWEHPKEFLTDAEKDCLTLTAIYRTRRHCDLVAALVGVVVCSAHLSLLVYIKVVRHGKSYELLMAHAVISLLSLSLLAVGCALDLCIFHPTDFALYFRAYIWLYLVNSLMAGYGNLIVVLCLDRYVAMHRPLYYRNVFVTKKMRISLISGAVIVGLVICAHWLVANRVTVDGGIEENYPAVIGWPYILARALSYVFKYIVPGVVMVVLTVGNINTLSIIERSYSMNDECRIASEHSRKIWIQNHLTISKISATLAISYIAFNWPYAIIDYFYTDELAESDVYAVVTLFINFMQVVYIQLNLLFFSLCSSVYRRALCSVLRFPSVILLLLLQHTRSFRFSHFSKPVKEQRISTNTVFTIC